MKEYVSERLEDSGIYIARDISQDCLELKSKSDRSVYLFLHSNPEGAKEFFHGNKRFHRLVYEGNFVTNIFYKDGINFFRLLSDEEKSALKNKSMKNYSFNEISKMVKLREKEQEVLRLQGDKRLVYYQPDNTSEEGRLREGLVSFNFRPIFSSYSHKNINDPGYDFIMADDGNKLLRRFISENKKELTGKLKPRFHSKSPRIFTLDNLNEAEAKTERNNQILNNELLNYFLNQTGTNLEDWGGDIGEYLNPQ